MNKRIGKLNQNYTMHPSGFYRAILLHKSKLKSLEVLSQYNAYERVSKTKNPTDRLKVDKMLIGGLAKRNMAKKRETTNVL